jgi:hypothetical protein
VQQVLQELKELLVLQDHKAIKAIKVQLYEDQRELLEQLELLVLQDHKVSD